MYRFTAMPHQNSMAFHTEMEKEPRIPVELQKTSNR
jgi:hypothetical protein